MAAADPGQAPGHDDEDAYIRLLDADWGEIYPRLLLFAHRHLQRTGLVATPKDLVQDAIAKTLAGALNAQAPQRHWNPTATTLFNHLRWVISSDCSHPSRVYRRLGESLDDSVFQIRSHLPTAEEGHAEQDYIDFVGRRDAEAGRVAELILHQGLKEATELSEAMGMPVSRIERLKKKLRLLSKMYLNPDSDVSEKTRKEGSDGV